MYFNDSENQFLIRCNFMRCNFSLQAFIGRIIIPRDLVRDDYNADRSDLSSSKRAGLGSDMPEVTAVHPRNNVTGG